MPQLLHKFSILLQSLGNLTKEAKSETEIYPVTTEAKTRKCSI